MSSSYLQEATEFSFNLYLPGFVQMEPDAFQNKHYKKTDIKGQWIIPQDAL